MNDHGDLNYFNTQLRHAPDTRSLYNLGFVKRNASKFGQKSLSAVTGDSPFFLSATTGAFWGLLSMIPNKTILVMCWQALLMTAAVMGYQFMGAVIMMNLAQQQSPTSDYGRN